MIGRLHPGAGLVRCILATTFVVALGIHAPAHAQGAPKTDAPKAGAPKAGAPQTTGSAVTGPPNALQGFSQNRDKPIQIDAARLEVRDKDKVATFFGDAKADVKVVQGDVTMRSKILVVFYDQEDAAKSGPGAGTGAGAGKSATAATPGPGGSSQIKRLEAKGNVIVTQKDQTVTGANGVFDMKSNTITMIGDVVMTQNDNVLRGDRLVVDMTTGVSRVSRLEGGRVQGLFKNNAQGKDKDNASKGSGTGSGTPGTAAQPGTSTPRGPLPLIGR
jgi:lipopolysaccharide export system protein LptA